MGFAFTFPIFRWLVGSKIACYVHYPTISTDMLSAIHDKRPGVVHNDSFISKSRLLTNFKVWCVRCWRNNNFCGVKLIDCSRYIYLGTIDCLRTCMDL
jgi:hypothetical protein